MSPRAAWRLETLGFERVYDYVGGKADWLGHALPREGEAASVPNAGERIVLGRVRQSALEGAEPDAPVEQVMEPGPSTVRPSMDARQLVERNLGAAIVTTPEGVLVGVFDRAKGERRLADLRA